MAFWRRAELGGDHLAQANTDCGFRALDVDSVLAEVIAEGAADELRERDGAPGHCRGREPGQRSARSDDCRASLLLA
ncbi:MAG: hypothetical protein U5L11_07245 [Arhodomonas sp.]|nr:hypothetical protein [Arhodomonas sp.]